MNRFRALGSFFCLSVGSALLLLSNSAHKVAASDGRAAGADRVTDLHAIEMITRGREIFRFDTFGDQQFWGSTLQLHKALEGQQFGGVGPGVDPATALQVGLKVDVDA